MEAGIRNVLSKPVQLVNSKETDQVGSAARYLQIPFMKCQNLVCRDLDFFSGKRMLQYQEKRTVAIL